jgi:NAD(P)-dependent dehydrogenase (short-subunit alcohol dehydrogenase family)
VSQTSLARVGHRAHHEPPSKTPRHPPVTALIAVALVMVVAFSDFYASRFWLDHPATTAILASLGVTLVSVTVIEVILKPRSERRWRLLAQYALLELAEVAKKALGCTAPHCRQRIGAPQDISKTALFLASEESSHITGSSSSWIKGMMCTL